MISYQKRILYQLHILKTLILDIQIRLVNQIIFVYKFLKFLK